MDFSFSPATNGLWIWSGLMACIIASIGLRAELLRSKVSFWPFVWSVLTARRPSPGLSLSMAAGAYLLTMLADSIRDVLHRSFWLFAQLMDQMGDGSRYGPHTANLAPYLTVLVVVTVLVELQCLRALLRGTTGGRLIYLFWLGAISSFVLTGFWTGFWPHPLITH